MYKKYLSALACFVLASSIAIAQETMTTFNLSLDDVSRLALENNFDIQLTKYDIQISREDIDSERSVYDTMLRATAGYTDDRSAVNSVYFANHTKSNAYSVEVSKKLPTGTEVAVAHSAGRGWVNQPAIVAYNPAYEADMRLSVAQDLGRNFFGMQDRGSVKVAMKDVQNATFLSLDKIEQILADVQKSYWALVSSQELYDIEQEFLAQAKRLYAIDQGRIEHGLIEEPQLLGSEANYHGRSGALLVAKNNLKTRENILKLQLNISEKGNVILMPVDDFEMKEPRVSLEDSLKNAFLFRRDYQKAMNEIARRDILVSMKKNSAWPEINLEASLARNGIDDSYASSAQNVADEDNMEFSTSLTVSVPLENRDAKAKLKQAEFEKAKALLDAKYLERKIAIEIVDQVRKCDIFYERLVSVRKAANLQTQKAIEQEKIFNQGRSDSDTVIRYQEDALAARIRAVNAFNEYYESLIDLKKKEGVLLAEYWDGEI